MAALWLAAAAAGCDPRVQQAPAPDTSQPVLIARADLFGDPARTGEQLSPRGDQVAFLAPRDGVLNLWVLAVEAVENARPLTDLRARGVASFAWAHDNTTLIFAVDERGDGRTRLFAVDANGATPPRALTPEGVHAEIIGLSARDPTGVVLAVRAGEDELSDVVRVDLASGAQSVLYRNTGGYSRFLLDLDNNLRLGIMQLAGGGRAVEARDAAGRWSRLFAIAPEDALTSRVLEFEAGGASFLMFDSTDRDRTALVRVNAATGEKEVVGESARADVVDVWLDPQSNAPEAFATEYLRREWRALGPEAQADIDFLDAQITGDFEVVSRDLADGRWLVIEESPTIPARSYLYDRAAQRLTLLFRRRPALENVALQPMTPVEIEARDGLTLVTYLTLPAGADVNGDGRPEAPVGLVIAPHDGPWARDSYGFSAMHQWLASRGYAVLSVNFRGSLGFSKAFANAGDREWGARIQEDIIDAARWAIDNRVARGDRIALVGAGFGGYAALAGATFAPREFRCAAAYGAFSDLSARIAAAPSDEREKLYRRIGDPRTAAGRQALYDRSPLYHASSIERPLLLALGAHDPLVSRAQADQLAASLRARAGALTYLIFPDEGRELLSTRNRLAYLSVLEHFLGDCLGGRVEPVGASFEGADLAVYDGAVNVPGLSAFARRPAPRAQRQVPLSPQEQALSAEDVHTAPVAAAPQPTP